MIATDDVAEDGGAATDFDTVSSETFSAGKLVSRRDGHILGKVAGAPPGQKPVLFRVTRMRFPFDDRVSRQIHNTLEPPYRLKRWKGKEVVRCAVAFRHN